MVKTTNEASTARVEAARRLNPAALEVRARLIEADNLQQQQGLRAAYLFAKELATVKNDADRYGLQGYQDLIDSLGAERTAQKYVAMAAYVKPEDIDRYEATLCKEGRVFTKTHLLTMAKLAAAADRRKAFDSWIANSYTTREFEDYTTDLVEAAEGAADEEGGADEADPSPAGFTAAKAVTKLQKTATALWDQLTVFDDIDLPVMRLNLPEKSVDVLDNAVRTLNDVAVVLPDFFVRLKGVPTPDTSKLTSGEDLLNAAKQASAPSPTPTPAPAKKASTKKASTKKASTKKASAKKVPVKKAATKKVATKSPVPKKAPAKKATGLNTAKLPGEVYQAPKKAKPAAGFKPPDRVADAVGSTLASTPTGPAASRRRGKPDEKA